MNVNDALLDYLFDGQTHVLRPALQKWLEASRRYAAFVAENRDKIRKKIRLTHDLAAAADLQWELEVAHLLHEDKRFNVAYEAYTREQPFGPDFCVTYTTSFMFNVEVTRVRVAVGDADATTRKQREAHRLVETTCNKLYQLVPNMPNVIAVAVPDLVTDEADFAAAMMNLRRRAEQRDSVTLARHGFGNGSSFFKAYERLSLVIVRGYAMEDESAPADTFLWRNPQTRQPLPAKAITALGCCFGGDTQREITPPPITSSPR